MRACFLSALACFVLESVLMAQSVTLSLVPSEPDMAAGSAASVDFVVLNRGSTAQDFTAPAVLTAEVAAGGQVWKVELHAAPAPVPAPDTVAPGSFASHTYTFTLPAAATGRIILEVRLPGFAPVHGVIDRPAAIAGGGPSPEGAKPAERVGKPITNLARAEPAASAIQRTFANRLAPYEPMYFIYGPDAPAAKFQFSFKYKLFAFTELSRQQMSRTLQFGYTQRSLWDIEAESSPFYDTSYMPELIFESLAAKPEARDSSFTWLGYQAAFKHESNGRAGPVSRSLNTVYLRPAFAFGKLSGWHLIMVPEVFAYVGSLENNPDLKDYRGYGQLRFVVGRNDGPSLLVSTRTGKELDHATVQLDLTFPVKTKLLNFETYLLLQYFNGYGESLLSYREESEAFRAGFSLVR